MLRKALRAGRIPRIIQLATRSFVQTIVGTQDDNKTILNLKKINKIEGGFSLIELIVVCAIIAIIVGVVLLNFRGFQSKDTLDIAARTLASDLRWSQNAAMSGLSQGAAKVYGYGIHTAGNNYSLFYANDVTDRTSVAGQIIRTVTLSNQITISSSDADIFFLPPDPQTIITPDPAPATSITITLSKSGLTPKTITVSTAGLISY